MALVTDQMQEKERNNEMMIEVLSQIMIGILSQIMGYRNGESGQVQSFLVKTVSDHYCIRSS